MKLSHISLLEPLTSGEHRIMEIYSPRKKTAKELEPADKPVRPRFITRKSRQTPQLIPQSSSNSESYSPPRYESYFIKKKFVVSNFHENPIKSNYCSKETTPAKSNSSSTGFGMASSLANTPAKVTWSINVLKPKVLLRKPPLAQKLPSIKQQQP